MSASLRAAWWAFIVVISLLMLPLAPVHPTHAQGQAQVGAQIGQAYSAILSAEQSGGNVSSLVKTLNSAISLVQEGNFENATNPQQASDLYSQASTIAQQVINEAPAIASAGRGGVLTAQLDLALETAVLAVLAAVAYLYLPRIFWRYWLRTHRDWRVKKA